MTKDLYLLAQQYAVQGNFQKKAEIYNAIEANPDATDIDRARVAIFRADQLRREGNPLKALEMLRQVQSCSDPETEFALGQSIGAARLCEYIKSGDPAALQAALDHQKRFVAHIAAALAPKLQRDRFPYAIELLLCLMVTSGDYQSAEALIESCRYEQMIKQIELPRLRDRANRQLLAIRADIAAIRGEAASAIEMSYRYFSEADSDYYKLSAAFQLLKFAARFGYGREDQRVAEVLRLLPRLGEKRAVDQIVLRQFKMETDGDILGVADVFPEIRRFTETVT